MKRHCKSIKPGLYLKANLVDAREKRVLALFAFLFQNGHDFLGRAGALDFLPVEQLRFYFIKSLGAARLHKSLCPIGVSTVFEKVSDPEGIAMYCGQSTLYVSGLTSAQRRLRPP